MKKRNFASISLLVICFCLLHESAISQSSSTYIFFRPVYAFPANVGKIDENSASIQNITYTKGLYGSFGNGLCLQLGIGKMISQNFGFELAAEWINGRRLKTNLTSDNDSLNGDASERIKALVFKPMVVLRNSGDLLSFYSKLGLTVSTYSESRSDVTVRIRAGGQSFEVKTSQIENIRAKIGYTAAFGLAFRISQAISVRGELNGQMISLPIHKGRFISYDLNGQDVLPTLTVNQKSWIYEKATSSEPQDPNKPEIKLYSPANFSYIGISVGISYFF